MASAEHPPRPAPCAGPGSLGACSPRPTAGRPAPWATGTGAGRAPPGCCCTATARRVPRCCCSTGPSWSHHGGTWGTPGGALHEGEPADVGALREVREELGLRPDDVVLGAQSVDDHGGWSTRPCWPARPGRSSAADLRLDGESDGAAWLPLAGLDRGRPAPGAGGARWPGCGRCWRHAARVVRSASRHELGAALGRRHVERAHPAPPKEPALSRRLATALRHRIARRSRAPAPARPQPQRVPASSWSSALACAALLIAAPDRAPRLRAAAPAAAGRPATRRRLHRRTRDRSRRQRRRDRWPRRPAATGGRGRRRRRGRRAAPARRAAARRTPAGAGAAAAASAGTGDGGGAAAAGTAAAPGAAARDRRDDGRHRRHAGRRDRRQAPAAAAPAAPAAAGGAAGGRAPAAAGRPDRAGGTERRPEPPASDAADCGRPRAAASPAGDRHAAPSARLADTDRRGAGEACGLAAERRPAGAPGLGSSA